MQGTPMTTIMGSMESCIFILQEPPQQLQEAELLPVVDALDEKA